MPATDKDVLAALSELIDPVTGRNFVESKSVKNVKVDGERVSLDVALGYPARGVLERVRAQDDDARAEEHVEDRDELVFEDEADGVGREGVQRAGARREVGPPVEPRREGEVRGVHGEDAQDRDAAQRVEKLDAPVPVGAVPHAGGD